jgi:glycosyltransferase involved in cell wall biosynthesis
MDKVYIIAAGNERGGAATHITALAEAVQAQGVKSQYSFVLIGNGPLQMTLRNILRTVIVLPSQPLRAVSQLTKLMRDCGGDCLWHAHGPRINLLTYVAAKMAGSRWTATIHSHVDNDFLASRWKSLILPKINRYCLQRTAGVFVGNPEFSEFVPGKPAFFVPNAVIVKPLQYERSHYQRALRERLGLAEFVELIGVAARLDPVKDIGTIIRAVTKLDDHIHLVIAGEGSELDALRQLADSKGVGDRVHFLGFVDDMAPFYAGLNLHVAASVSEGASPFFILESGAYGVPNIGTDIPGIRNLIVHGETGRTFPVGDSMQLAIEITTLLADKVEIRKLVRNFKETVLQKYTSTSMLEAYQAGYKQLSHNSDL